MALPSIVGFTRFSVNPASIIPPGIESRPMDKLRSAIYDPIRLGRRFQLFEAFALPSIVAAARRHAGFQHVILVSPDLPVIWKDRLERSVSPYRQWLHIKTIHPNDSFPEVTCRAIGKLSNGGRSFNFRLDDDDALRPEFVDKVLELSSSCEDGKIISFDLGYYVQRLKGESFRIHEKTYPKIAIGLGVFSAPDTPTSIFEQGVHNKIAPDRVFNVQDAPYWIRTLHAHNDSGMRSTGVPPVTLREACNLLQPIFGHLPLEQALMTLTESNAIGKDDTAVRALFHIQ